MKIDYLNKNISHINRVPQIVRQQEGFYSFIQELCNYCDESSRSIYNILSNVEPIWYIDKHSNITFLQRLLTKLGINLNWMPATFDAVDSEAKVALYKMAIQGFAVLRNSDSTPVNLKQLLSTIFSIATSSIEIKESLTDTTMSYEVVVNEINQPITNDYLSNYIKPNITGVASVIQFNTSGYFSSMKFKKSAETGEETGEETDYNNFKGSICWMEYDSVKKEEIKVGEGTVYNDTGCWSTEYK